MNEIDKLFDENNADTILLYNQNGEPVSFEQIAVIPIDGVVYFIMRPVVPMEGVGEDEGLVFTVCKDERGEETIDLVTDMDVIDAVFDVYDRLIAEELAKGE